VPNIPRLSTTGEKDGTDFDRNLFLRRRAETRRKVADAQAQREAELKRQLAAIPDRTFADQIEALRRLTSRQIALLEALEATGGMLDPKQFKALQSLAFVVRSLSAEARAQALGWDPTKLSDGELAAEIENGPGDPPEE